MENQPDTALPAYTPQLGHGQSKDGSSCMGMQASPQLL